MMSPPLPLAVRVLESALQWARAHPSFFFHEGIVSAEALVEQLVAGAQALGATQVDVRSSGSWFIVASERDWFLSARFPVPEDLDVDTLVPFPELGQNCVRPECAVAAFAESAIVRGPAGALTIRGNVAPDEPVLAEMANARWQRAIAFRLPSSTYAVQTQALVRYGR